VSNRPEIESSQVSEPQCSIVAALSSLGGKRSPPQVRISNAVVPSGATLEGSIENGAGGDLRLYLIDDEGNVIDLRRWSTRTGRNMNFSLPVHLEQAPGSVPPSSLIPGLVLASSGETRDLTATKASELASNLIENSRLFPDFAVGVGYFQLMRPDG